MAVKKTQLYASLWASCDKLRGGMDSSEYKDYILTLLFMKYVTDKFKNKGAYEDIKVFDKAHDKDPDPEKRTGCSFDDFIALKGKKNIGEGMDKIIARLADENTDLKGVIDIAHFNDEKKLGSGKEMVDKLTDLISIFQRPELDFSRNKAEGDDIIGDAYEYLMRKFATESGKSKGQFYTPAEVSRILANVVGISRCTDSSATVCDPACGSGSLLIRAVDAAPIPIMGFGQEKESTTAGLAKMNAVLHRKAEIVEHENIRQTIYKNAEFSEYGEKLDEAFAAWKTKEYPTLSSLDEDVSARELIVSLAEDILAEFEHLTLIDKYDVYQVLLAYWNEVMNDDVSLIISEPDGYANARATDNIEEEITQGKNKGEMKVTGWEGRLIPKAIVIDAFFREEKNAIEEAENVVTETESLLSDLIESADEESALADVAENGKVKAKDLEAKIEELTQHVETEETIELELLMDQLPMQKKRLQAYLVGHPLCESAVTEKGTVMSFSIRASKRCAGTISISASSAPSRGLII